MPTFLAAARTSVEKPREAARYVLAMKLDLGTASLALAAVAVVTAIFTAMVSMIAASAGGDGLMQMSPLQWALLQLAGMFVSAGLIAYAGRWFGGHGDLAGATALLAWAQVITLILQVIQLVALFILPPLTPILALIGVGITIWLLVNFIAELHGFSSLIKVFFGILGVSFAVLFFVATMMAALLGASGG